MRRLFMIPAILFAGCGDKPDVAQLVGDLTWTTFTEIIDDGLGTMTQTASCADGGTIAVDLSGIDTLGRFPVIYTACADRGYVFDGEIRSSLGSNQDVYTLKITGTLAITGEEDWELAFTELQEVVSFEATGMSSFTMELFGKVDVTENGELFRFDFAQPKMFRYDQVEHRVSEM
jgi:hypothetical protein